MFLKKVKLSLLSTGLHIYNVGIDIHRNFLSIVLQIEEVIWLLTVEGRSPS
jgi:hypothetical protein